MHKHSWLIVSSFVLLIIGACSQEATNDDGLVHPHGDAYTSGDGYPLADITLCPGEGTLDAELSFLDDSGDFADTQAWFSVVQQFCTEEAPYECESEVVSFMSEFTDNSGIALSCQNGLTETGWYPSAVFVLDTDGDGTCSSGDLGALFQYYGFAYDLEIDLSLEDLLPVDQLRSWDGHVCDYFFP